MTSLNIMWLLCRCSIVYGLHVWSCPALCLWVSSVLLAFLSPCLRKRELVIVLIVHLFVSYAHVNLCHVFSSSWCQGLAATSACGSSWTLVFTFFLIIMLDIMKKYSVYTFEFQYLLWKSGQSNISLLWNFEMLKQCPRILLDRRTYPKQVTVPISLRSQNPLTTLKITALSPLAVSSLWSSIFICLAKVISC